MKSCHLLASEGASERQTVPDQQDESTQEFEGSQLDSVDGSSGRFAKSSPFFSSLRLNNANSSDMRSGCDNDLVGSHSGCEAQLLDSRQQEKTSEGNQDEPIKWQLPNCNNLSSSLANNQPKIRRLVNCGQANEVGKRSKLVKQVSASANEQVIDQRRRERSSSATSDYFSSLSQHNSPIVVLNKKLEANQSKESADQPIGRQRRRRTTIYENPTFASDAFESRGSKMIKAERGKRSQMKSDNNNNNNKLKGVEKEERNMKTSLRTSEIANSNYEPQNDSLTFESNSSSSSISLDSASDQIQRRDGTAHLNPKSADVAAEHHVFKRKQRQNPNQIHNKLATLETKSDQHKLTSIRTTFSPPVQATSDIRQSEMSEQPNYYYSPIVTQRANVRQLNSLTSSQHTNETCDESPDDQLAHHYYQVVVPAEQRYDALPKSNQEPLIRSSSWQNKTLINLNQQPVHYLESSLIQKTLPSARYTQFPQTRMELLQLNRQKEEHLYCGLGTLRPTSDHQRPTMASNYLENPPLAHFKNNSLNDSFHTLIGKMNERHFYQIQPPVPQPLRPADRRGRGHASNSSSDSTLAKLNARPCPTSTRLCLLLFAGSTLACLLLLALLSNYQPLIKPTATNDKVEPNQQITTIQQQQQIPISANEFKLRLNHQFNANQIATTSSGLYQPTEAPRPRLTTESVAHSTQSYWLEPEQSSGQCRSAKDCSSNGLCESGSCVCFAGFSAPTCAKVDCPNVCSTRGTCNRRPDTGFNLLDDQRSHLQSVSFQTLSQSRRRNSVCRDSYNRSNWDNLQVKTYDNRVEWRCQCDAQFSGPDCSQLKELHCDNNLDDDNDGLTDCEDDDCCENPICNDNLLCLKSPEPISVLAALSVNSLLMDQLARNQSQLAMPIQSTSNFFTQMRFFVGQKSVQSYANESMFDPNRVAVIRGKVVRSADAAERGIVGVRVGVIEHEFGFSLTRDDGYFDLLVNGSEWLTLRFQRNGYALLKRKIFVKPRSINLLESNVELLVNSGNNQQIISKRLDASFNLQRNMELHKLASARVRDDERRKNALFECLISATHLSQAVDLEPQLFVASENQRDQLLRTLILASEVAYQTELSSETNLRPIYSSASFPLGASALKPSISLQLLSADRKPPDQLKAVIVQLDVEGQWRRERLAPLQALGYQFAWNRRNVYEQKVYGFSELNVRIGYEFQLNTTKSLNSLWNECLMSIGEDLNNELEQDRVKMEQILTNPHLNKQVVWFERKLYIEAHQLNQHADVGRWNLANLHRFDPQRELIYFGSGQTLPIKLIYPPTISKPIKLSHQEEEEQQQQQQQQQQEEEDEQKRVGFDHSMSRLMTSGPNGSMFVLQHAPNSRWLSSSSRLIQLDSSAKRRILEVPLSTLTSKMGLAFNSNPFNEQSRQYAIGDVEILYNKHMSTLYLSSKIAAKIVKISYQSLQALNRTFASGSASSTASAEETIHIEPLCGFGRQLLGVSLADSMKLTRATRLAAPHSMTLDEERQLLYFVDGSNALLALDLSSHQVARLQSQVRGVDEEPQLNPIGHKSECRKSDLRFPFGQFKVHQMEALVWSKADSSLYFLDQNTLFALRQDLMLEVIAFGVNLNNKSARPDNSILKSIPSACLSTADNHQLGLIKTIAIDESDNDLLLVHQFAAHAMRQQKQHELAKVSGRLYLAKVKLGFGNGAGSSINRVIDLHSANSTWDPMILKALNSQSQRKTPSTINWTELANLPTKVALDPSEQSVNWQAKRIPFIHLSRGFGQIDSIEFNSDGSIFVLDLSANSIKLILPYSLNEFNLVELHNSNINRLFATNSDSSSSYLQTQRMLLAQVFDDDLEERRKLKALIVQNPISNEVMLFHSSSGLQLSLISSNGIKSEFYYKIMRNTNENVELDEDDKNDYDVQRLVLNERMINGEFSQTLAHLISSFVRLNKILDSTRNEYELTRVHSGTRFVLKSILLNHNPICYITTDYLGALITYQTTGKDYMELTYDRLTYLLSDMVTKVGETGELSSQSFVKDWRMLKRISQDNVFYHYCDMFIVNA